MGAVCLELRAATPCRWRRTTAFPHTYTPFGGGGGGWRGTARVGTEERLSHVRRNAPYCVRHDGDNVSRVQIRGNPCRQDPPGNPCRQADSCTRVLKFTCKSSCLPKLPIIDKNNQLILFGLLYPHLLHIDTFTLKKATTMFAAGCQSQAVMPRQAQGTMCQDTWNARSPGSKAGGNGPAPASWFYWIV